VCGFRCCIFVVLFSSSYLRLYTRHIYYIGINNHNPTEDIPTLTKWWGLRGQMILRSMLAVAWLLVGPSMPYRSMVMTQTKRDTLGLQVAVWAWGWPHPVKIYLLRCPSHSSFKVLWIENSHPSLKGRRKGSSLPCSPKWSPYGNTQNEFTFLGMGNFLVQDLIPNLSFIVTIL
jgi:hypothetical protein